MMAILNGLVRSVNAGFNNRDYFLKQANMELSDAANSLNEVSQATLTLNEQLLSLVGIDINTELPEDMGFDFDIEGTT
jgi:hypothetical protein